LTLSLPAFFILSKHHAMPKKRKQKLKSSVPLLIAIGSASTLALEQLNYTPRGVATRTFFLVHHVHHEHLWPFCLVKTPSGSLAASVSSKNPNQ